MKRKITLTALLIGACGTIAYVIDIRTGGVFLLCAGATALSEIVG